MNGVYTCTCTEYTCKYAGIGYFCLYFTCYEKISEKMQASDQQLLNFDFKPVYLAGLVIP